MSLDGIARRFGLRAAVDGDVTTVSRHGAGVRFYAALLTHDAAARNAAFCACLGVRLGLDLMESTRAGGAERSIAELDWVQRLLPRAVIRVAERVAGASLFERRWLDGVPFNIVHLREAGKLLLPMCADDAPRDDVCLTNTRRALFYDAYQLRPVDRQPWGGGELRTFRTTAGLGSSIATLFPDFDLDAATDRGLLAPIGYDTLLLWVPQPTDAPRSNAAIRHAIRQAVRNESLPFSQRVYPLRNDRIVVGEVCGAHRDFDPADLLLDLLSDSR